MVFYNTLTKTSSTNKRNNLGYFMHSNTVCMYYKKYLMAETGRCAKYITMCNGKPRERRN